MSRKVNVPICEKLLLTIEETSEYSNIGKDKLYKMINEPNCDFVLNKGTHKLIKRKQFEKFIDELYVI